jgi:hypothetical protein
VALVIVAVMIVAFVIVSVVGMVVAFVILAFMSMIFLPCACGCLSRVWLKVAFDSVGRTQRFAFQVRRGEPIELPLLRFTSRKPYVSARKPFIFTNKTPFTLRLPPRGCCSTQTQLHVAGECLISW